jgi:hypothetical protein
VEIPNILGRTAKSGKGKPKMIYVPFPVHSLHFVYRMFSQIWAGYRAGIQMWRRYADAMAGPLVPFDALLTEAGDPILTEAGDYLLRES